MIKYPLAMLDLETMDTLPTARVLSIGAVRFNDYGEYDEDVLYAHPSLREQQKRTVSKRTLDFWNQQSEEAIQEAFRKEEERTGIEQIHKDLRVFLSGVREVWANSPSFDIAILDDLFGEHRLPKLWKFWELRDVRTLKALRKKSDLDAFKCSYPSHHPIGDCLFQIYAIFPILEQNRS